MNLAKLITMSDEEIEKMTDEEILEVTLENPETSTITELSITQTIQVSTPDIMKAIITVTTQGKKTATTTDIKTAIQPDKTPAPKAQTSETCSQESSAAFYPSS